MSNYTKSTNFATKDNLTPGDPLKVVRGTEIDTEYNNIATAIATKTDNASAAITGGTITGITDLAVADGGTGASTAAGGLNNLLPTQTGNANKYLQTDGTNATWDAVTLSTADITGTLAVANGGTGVTSSTGTGSVVLSNSPTLVTPALGTPASGVATNLTGLPISTGVSGLGTGVATFLGTPSSANLASAVSDETGSGALVFANSPTLVTPALGTPSALVGTNITGTASGLTAGNVTTNANLTGAVTSVGNATSLGSFTSAQLLGALSDETGTGSAVFATSPTLVTPALGTPSALVGTNITGTAANFNINGTVGATTASTGAFTTLTTSSTVTHNGGTANGVTYLNGSKVLSSGSALQFNGTNQFTVLAATGTTYNRTESTQYSTFVQHFAASGNTGVEYKTAYRFVDTDVGELMRLDSTGLGIGTSSPSRKLVTKFDSASTWSTSDFDSTSNNLYVQNANTTINAFTGIQFLVGGNGEAAISAIRSDDGAADIAFGTRYAGSRSQKMLLTAAGNLGLGVTPNVSDFTSGALGMHIKGSSNYGILKLESSDNKITWLATGSAATYLYVKDANPLIFGTNNTERARITSGGYFKASNTGTYFGSTGSYHELRNDGVAGDWTTRISNTTATAANAYGVIIEYTGSSPNGTGNEFIECRDNAGGATTRAAIRSNGGIANYSGNDVNLSDRREKTNFAPATSYLDKICAIPVQTFNYIDQNMEDDGGLTLGVVAQDVQAIAPELVMESNWASKDAEPKMRLSIYQTDLQYALMKCIQEQQVIIESLKARLDAANL